MMLQKINSSAATTYQNINSSIVSKGAMNSFNEIFPLARMFPLAVIHRGYEMLVFQKMITFAH